MIDLEPLNLVPKSEVLAFPAIREMPDGTILGNQALRLPQPHRVLLASRVRLFRHEDGIMYRDVETAFARRYIASLPSRSKKVRKAQLEGFRQSSVPVYCDPFISDDQWFYVDLKSAYAQVYQRICWRTEYLRNRYFGVSEDGPMKWPYPNDWKVGRSSVISMALPFRNIQYIKGGVPQRRDQLNPYSNPSLVACVWDVLSAIARVAIDIYGARYALVDCAVVDSKNLKGYCDFLDQYGFDYRIKCSGFPRINSIGNWQIGDTMTQPMAQSRHVNSGNKRDKVGVTMDEAEWIITSFDLQTRAVKRISSLKQAKGTTSAI